MEAQTVDTLPPIAADHDPVRCLLAIELSKKSWIVAITTALSDKISRYTLDGCDWKGLLELMERIRTRVAREVGRPVEMISCYEAGYDRFWLHRLLERHGVRSHVIDPASVQVDRRGRRAQTDHIDAKGPSINNSVNSLFDGMFSVPARSCSSNRRERDGGRD